MGIVKRIAFFVAVGCAAAAVHFGVVVLLVELLRVPPLAANVAGWLLAFVVSFLGQWQLTFASRATPWRDALPRYFLLSLAGFVANEIGYAVLLQFTRLPYQAALVLVLLAVAVMTYLLGSQWVFRRTRAHEGHAAAPATTPGRAARR
jgi:putative flippase GtrA